VIVAAGGTIADMIDHLRQLAIHAYYCGEHDAGRRACEKALRLPGIPDDVERNIRENRVWYTRSLSEMLPSCRLTRLHADPAAPDWSVFNPALAADDHELLCIVRSSNYRIEAGRYVVPEADNGRIRTRNILCRISPSGVVSNGVLLHDPDYQATGYPVEGLEDCRLLRVDDHWYVSATVRNAAPGDGRCRVGLSRLDTDAGRLVGLTMLDSLQLQTHEKNWMPIEGRGLSWLHSASFRGHTVTVDPSPDMPGCWSIHQRHEAPPIARGFRGGSQLVKVDGGYLTVVHEVAAHGNHRAYEHRFVLFADDLRIVSVSPAFAFREPRTIEFAAGMAVIGNRVFVTFGVNDAEAWLCEIDAEELCRIMTAAW
jgi:predicted GH43/DUF377 family glycosyl hydrolase